MGNYKKTPAAPQDECASNPIIRRKRGRPGKSPSGDFEYVLRLVRLGFNDSDIKKKLNITDRTWMRWLSQGDNREKLKAWRAETELGAHQALYDQAVNRRTVGALGLYLDRIEGAGRRK